MTAQELKNSILMQAVQGKLVPQDPNDEPASVLLAKIRAEKEQMMKEGKIKKEPISEIYIDPSDNQHYEKVGKTVKCIEDEIPFKIPKGWAWVRISSISSVVTKGTTPRGGNVSYKEKGIGFLRAGNVAGLDTIDKSDLNFIDADTHTGYLSRSILEANDILITIAGTLGRTALVRNEDLPLNANQAISIVRLITTNSIDLLYLIYAINSPVIQKHLTTQRKITAIPNLTLEIISKCFIPIPPFEEQKRIVSRFKEILPYINNYEWDCKKLKKMDSELPNNLKKSILQYAIQGKLVEQNPDDEPASELIKRIRAEKEKLIKSGKLKKDKNESFIYRGSDNSYYEKFQNGKEVCIDNEIPFEIPQSWAWCRLSYAMSVYGGKRIPAGQKLVTEDTGHKYIRVTDMKNSSVSNSDVHYITNEVYEQIKRYTISCDDLYITVAGTIGKVGNIPIEFDGANLTENANKLITYDLDNDYVKLMMNSAAIQNQITEATTKVGQPKLAIMRIKSLLIPLPPIAEQQRIVSKIKECLNLLK